MTKRAALLCLAVALAAGSARAAEPVPAHGIAMHGDLKYGPGFTHFDYADPDAPKGGTVRLAAVGTFDTLNGFVIKGNPASGLGGLYDTLLARSDDEPFSMYGLLAETVTVPDDRSWVEFTLRKEARWHDGKPITPADVSFTLGLLKEQGRPFYRHYFKDVTGCAESGPRKVKCVFADGTNRELPLILGEMAILPKHYWEGRDFSKTTLEAPLGSGPYKVGTVDPARRITYERVADYWGRDLAVNRGRYNADRMIHDYYRDGTVALEALKAGDYDFRLENVAKDWATGYDVPAVRDGLLKKEEIAHESTSGMQGFVFNLRRPLFADRKVRQALGLAFDFEWANKNLFFGQYTRTRSYFANSDLASSGLPQGEELAILEKYRDGLPPEVFTASYEPPVNGDPRQVRDNLRQAIGLLKEAGWEVRDGRLVNGATGQPFEFEILLSQPTWERIALPFAKNLERLGITARVRVVDATVYQERMDQFDYDMIVDVFGQSQSPGNEQLSYWGSASADLPGSPNSMGLKDPAVDDLVALLIAAPDRKSLVARTRALDRVLLWGHYVIPHWHLRVYRVAYWDKFGRPAITPKYALGFEFWWIDAAREAALAAKRQAR